MPEIFYPPSAQKSTALTPEQQKTAADLMPMAQQLAKRYGEGLDHEEAEGVALVGLCEAIRDDEPHDGVPTEQFVKMKVANTLKNWRKREMKLRKAGLTGGAPSAREITSTTHLGRREEQPTGINGTISRYETARNGLANIPRVRRSSHTAQITDDEDRGGTSHDLAANVGVDDTTPETEVYWSELLDGLPDELRGIAYAKWRESKTSAEIATEFGVPCSTVKDRVKKAEVYAARYIYGDRLTVEEHAADVQRGGDDTAYYEYEKLRRKQAAGKQLSLWEKRALRAMRKGASCSAA